MSGFQRRLSRASAALMLCAACGQARQVDASTAQTSDVETVVNALPDAKTPVWRIAVDSPLVTIGGSDDPDVDYFEQFPSPLRLSDGRVLVADWSKTPLRVYSPNGRLIKRFPAGGGPQDLKGPLSLVRTAGDTVVAIDPSNGRFSIISPDLEVVRVIPGAHAQQRAELTVFDKMADGRWLGMVQTWFADNFPRHAGVFRPEVQLVELPANWGEPRVVATFPGPEMAGVEERGAKQMTIPNLGAISLAEWSSQGLYVSLGEAPEIELRAIDGTIRRRIRLDAAVVPITPADREAFIQEQLKELKNHGWKGEHLDNAEADLRGRPFGRHYPFFLWLTAADDGSLWVIPYERKPAPGSRYLVFDPNGKLVATTSLPPGIELVSISADLIVVTTKNDDEAYQVKVLPIRRPSR